ncbi:hypothetical protein V2G26_018377 [Clonostachys chloroleuca]|uniref:Nuclease S1 n=1 Tax=Clonostachys chloroleuca TaxID=1926264 RepID=A0AA35M2D5_9HYPO|nr:unnamed protein product [Clonostachys chloroleuca]
MMFSPIFVLFSLLYLPSVTAWGALGHNTTAWVASHFVSEATAGYLKDLLHNHDEDYLASIASWADIPGNSRRTDHFIDAHDDLANRNCNVNYARDCKQEGCIISALAEYTEQALAPATGNGDIDQAVKLLVHFIGDLHQPLHNEDVAQGGTQLHVRWESSDRTLHKVWDTQIAEKLTEELGGRPIDRASRWADQLASKITDREFADQRRDWLKHLDVRNPNGTAMIWSQETNKLVCSNVFPRGFGPDQIRGKELSENYYEQAWPVVERQVARAGYRMAAWLDAVAEQVNGRGQGEL